VTRARWARHAATLALLALAPPIFAQRARAAAAPITLETFDDTAGWSAAPSDGVRLGLRSDNGVVGRALRLEFDFQGHAGYAVARHAFTLPSLPPHWAITLRTRGEALPNTLEIKLIDSSGLNVWWMRRVPLTVTHEWATLRFRPSDLSFAWGPLGGGPPKNIAAMEIAITAGAGGTGWIDLDELTLVPLPLPVADNVRPRVTASSSASGALPSAVLRSDFARAPTRGDVIARTGGWRSAGDDAQQVTLSFGGPRALSGLALDWDATDWARDYDVQSSDDGTRWATIREVRNSAGGRRFVHLPELETGWLRLVLHHSSANHGYRLASVHVLPAAAAPTRTAFIQAVADAAPLGDWPRAFTHQQSYWTVFGLPRDERDALISEDGSIESAPGGFSVEPFLYDDGKLLTWRDGRTTQSLDGGWRPIPSVRRTAKNVALEITAFATGVTGHAALGVRYRVVNRTAAPRTVKLSLALRPVQVNPPWQFLGTPGGAASVTSLMTLPLYAEVDSGDIVVPVTPGATGRAIAFDAGSVVDALRRGALPADTLVQDPTGFASGAYTWTLPLRAHDSTDVWIALPSGNGAYVLSGPAALDSARRLWDGELGAVELDLPGTGAAMARTLRSALSHVLVNARGPAIQPGTRSYRRSWIRDGALTSSALLRLGHAADVRAFLDWFSPYVFANGKVPCCVDARGADPVTENDADGELLYLAAEYWRMTHDTATIRRHWPVLARTAAHLDSLRRSRRTATYQSPDSLLVFALLPPSISHEGYSAKPAYSYWDDWWGVRGMADAGLLARVAGDSSRVQALTRSAVELRTDVVASVARAMTVHKMTVMPGAADLGDFDPTSSTIALEPAQARGHLPERVLRATFDSAWASFVNRRDGKTKWENYTPYEWRQVGSFIRLDQPERALALAEWYMAGRRPTEWNQWAEVVWRDARAPKFIGDMPHGWVESDFIRATLDMVEYERESDSTLVVGAGIPLAWARSASGVTARGIHTWWGTLDLTMRRAGTGTGVTVTVAGVTPPNGIEVRAPFGAAPRSALVNSIKTELIKNGRAVIVRAPAKIEFQY
jgi:hypothetical protein